MESPLCRAMPIGNVYTCRKLGFGTFPYRNNGLWECVEFGCNQSHQMRQWRFRA